MAQQIESVVGQKMGDFDRTLLKNEPDVQALVELLEQAYEVLVLRYASGGWQRLGEQMGFDCRLRCRFTRQVFSVEIKTEYKGAKTGNWFVETVADDRPPEGNTDDVVRKRGWAVTCGAQYIILYVPEWREAYCLPAASVKAKLPHWLGHYPTRKKPNHDASGAIIYRSHGLLVPIVTEIKPLAVHTFATDKPFLRHFEPEEDPWLTRAKEIIKAAPEGDQWKLVAEHAEHVEYLAGTGMDTSAAYKEACLWLEARVKKASD